MKIKILSAALLISLSSNAFSANQTEELLQAINNRNVSKVDSLIRYGLDVNQNSSLYNTRPLMHAVDAGAINIVQKLIEHGSKVDVTDNFGNTPLIQSIKTNKNDIAKVLIQHSRNINSIDRKGSSALHLAAKQGDENLFRAILKRGGNLQAIDDSGNNVLFYAIAGRNKEIINRLLNMEYFDLSHTNRYGENAVNIAQRYDLPEITSRLYRGRNR